MILSHVFLVAYFIDKTGIHKAFLIPSKVLACLKEKDFCE